DTGQRAADRPDVPAGRHGVQQFARQDLLLRRALHVDDRRGAGYGHGLFDRADPQLDVDRGREVGRQLDAFADDDVEAGEREGHLVDAGTKVDDAVQAGFVGGDGTNPFDEDVARRFDG